MSWPTPDAFNDVADALGIAYPAVVEKDFFGVQLLQLVQQLAHLDYQLVFAGGTCLAKAHCQTYRMSEDIDMKLVPTERAYALSKSQQRNSRKKLHLNIVAFLEASKTFSLVSTPIIRNEYRYQQFLIRYPSGLKSVTALRPHLQLELTESVCLQKTVTVPISSLYAEVAKIAPELNACVCVGLESIAAEKLVSLLRRTAAFIRNPDQPDDPTLIRHLYDLHLIFGSELDETLFHELLQNVIQIDSDQFGNQHPEFKDNPIAELKMALKHLQTETIHQERYRDFIGPLVYHRDPVTWAQALKNFIQVCAFLETGRHTEK